MVLVEKFVDLGDIGYVAFNKGIAGVARCFCQILEVPGVGQCIKVYNFDIRKRLQDMTDEIGTDKSATTGDEKFHLNRSLRNRLHKQIATSPAFLPGVNSWLHWESGLMKLLPAPIRYHTESMSP